MGWFSRKSRALDELPRVSDSDQKWGVAKGDAGGGPLIVRFNQGAKDWCAHPGLSIKLGFAIPLRRPNEGGLPDPAENEQLGGVEETILREVEARTIGVQALVLTTGVMKEYVFYIPEGVDIRRIHEAVQIAVTTHEVQCMAVKEPTWESYKTFVPA